MKIADLWADVGFKFDQVKLRDLNKIIGDLRISSILGATSLGSLALGTQKIVSDATKASLELAKLKEATGLDPVRIQQVDTYFQSWGASAGEAANALHHLNQVRLEVLSGEGDPRPFVMTGLVPTTDTLTLLNQIHERFSDTSFLKNWAASFAPGAKSLDEMRAAWKEMIANQFGIPTSMLRGLSASNEEWEKQYKLLALNADEITRAADAHKEWTTNVHNLNVELTKMGANLAPLGTLAARVAGSVAKTINNSVGMKNLQQIGGMGNAFFKLMDLGDSIKNKEVAGSDNVRSRVMKIMDESGLDHMMRQPQATGVQDNSVKVTTGPITVHAKDGEDFGDKFHDYLQEQMRKDIQFGQQT